MTIPIGATSATITVTPIDDSAVEARRPSCDARRRHGLPVGTPSTATVDDRGRRATGERSPSRTASRGPRMPSSRRARSASRARAARQTSLRGHRLGDRKGDKVRPNAGRRSDPARSRCGVGVRPPRRSVMAPMERHGRRERNVASAPRSPATSADARAQAIAWYRRAVGDRRRSGTPTVCGRPCASTSNGYTVTGTAVDRQSQCEGEARPRLAPVDLVEVVECAMDVASLRSSSSRVARRMRRGRCVAPRPVEETETGPSPPRRLRGRARLPE